MDSLLALQDRGLYGLQKSELYGLKSIGQLIKKLQAVEVGQEAEAEGENERQRQREILFLFIFMFNSS